MSGSSGGKVERFFYLAFAPVRAIVGVLSKLFPFAARIDPGPACPRCGAHKLEYLSIKHAYPANRSAPIGAAICRSCGARLDLYFGRELRVTDDEQAWKRRAGLEP